MDAHKADSRVPEEEDVIAIARALNHEGVRYVMVGVWAMNFHGCTRTTQDIDVLIARDLANQARVKRALTFLPNQAIMELGDEDIAQWVVVRVFDDITIDLMTEACGLRYDDVIEGAEWLDLEGVRIPFANPRDMLRMKQTYRYKDVLDRSYLERLLAAPGDAAPPA
jgi:hypothetical protein